jgi:ribonuclease HI
MVKATAICDGRGNAGTGARAAVLYIGEGVHGDRYERAEKLPATTNIVAEHLAIQLALELAKEHGVTELVVFNDSRSPVNQVNGSFQVKKEHLIPIVAKTREMASEFVSFELKWIGRESTREADALCRAIDGPGGARDGLVDRPPQDESERQEYTPNRSVEAASLFIAEPDRDVFLLDLVDSWASHVCRFVKEASVSGLVTGSRHWGADDWIGALYIRDHLERVLERLGIGGTLATVEVTDELFRRFTVTDVSGALRLSGIDDLPHEPWWWLRVPTTGPVAYELATWSRAAPARTRQR